MEVNEIQVIFKRSRIFYHYWNSACIIIYYIIPVHFPQPYVERCFLRIETQADPSWIPASLQQEGPVFVPSKIMARRLREV